MPWWRFRILSITVCLFSHSLLISEPALAGRVLRVLVTIIITSLRSAHRGRCDAFFASARISRLLVANVSKHSIWKLEKEMARKRSSWRSTGRRIGKALGRKSPARRRANFVRPVELGVERLEPRWVLAAGALDTTFDPIDLDGILIGNLGAPATANVRFNTITTQSDGKILAAGTYDLLSNNEQDFLVARFNADGSLDTTFGIDGPDVGSAPDGFINFDFSFASSQNSAEDITVDALGRIIVVGSGPAANNFLSWTVARLTSNGVLDTTFNGTGKVVTAWTGTFGNVGASAYGVAVQSDGKIVVAGDVRNSIFLTDIDFGLVRYNDNGTLDSTFGTGGKVVTDFFGRTDQAFDVKIQSDGKIVAGGYARTLTANRRFRAGPL